MTSAHAQTLWALERGFWLGDARFYQQHLAPDALMLLPMANGTVGAADVIATVGDAPRWRDVEMANCHTRQPSSDVAILAYRARGEREDGDDYEALVASTYVRRDRQWQLLFHQQTPLADRAA